MHLTSSRVQRLLWLCYCLATISEFRLHAAWSTHWDFSNEPLVWSKSASIDSWTSTPEGLRITAKAEDPYIFSPEIRFPDAAVLLISLRLKSTGDSSGQIFFGSPFSEQNSRSFSVINDGQWHEYQIVLPPLTGTNRLRLDPSHGPGTFTVAWLRAESASVAPAELWANPMELRNKKLIGGGLYATYGGDSAFTPNFLARHPHVLGHYPFDGAVLPVALETNWLKSLALPREIHYFHELAWNTVRIPYEAIRAGVDDLNRIQWGSVTDNFLLFGMLDGSRGTLVPDLTLDSDWAALEHNARLAGRLCREAKLQGFWLDTEQYVQYRWRTTSGTPEFDPDKPKGLHFPMGKDHPEILRKRGTQWIRAVQAELPAVKILITFAWSPDANEYGPLKGTSAFLDGVLEGMEMPGQLIHGYENTFYYGHAPGTTHTQEGFPGGRQKYESARASMHDWRAFSSNPKKYDQFVRVGMAAWVEDDPWNNPEGWPSGTKASLWSNIPLALAHADEYVWAWAEHTKYGQPGMTNLNPFLASIRNQTFNTGQEASEGVNERFGSDPLRHGWYFDFDMLAIGRRASPAHAVPTMSPESVPYRWIPNRQGLEVNGSWPDPEEAAPKSVRKDQRRRYVHPVRPVDDNASIDVTFELQIDSFASKADNPILLGLFSAAHPIHTASLLLRVDSPDRVSLASFGGGTNRSHPIRLSAPLQTGTIYRARFHRSSNQPSVSATLLRRSEKDTWLPLGSATVPTGSTSANAIVSLDEIGVALAEEASATPPGRPTYQYLLRQVTLSR